MNPKALCLSAALLLTANLSADTKKSAPAVKTEDPSVHTVSKAKVEAIRKLMAITGVLDTNLAGARDAIKGMKKNSPAVNPLFWGDLESKVTSQAFEPVLMAIYDHNYSLEEIKGLTRFFESPAGKAFMEKNATVQTETGRSLQAYMEANSKELMKKYAPQPKKN